ncbi:MAG: DUF4065 domain-containing protein [Anaerolineae bacterium]|nr:DUF4065 domain-containing protein [Anaerolineae bacterium]
MANVFDVAVYILRKQGFMTAMKLHKLLYYAQAWSLVWDDQPLFPEEIQAWTNGPVAPRLYAVHKGRYKVDTVTFLGYGNDRNLTALERDTINAVLAMYGKKSPEYLSALTHEEAPWRQARKGLPEKARGDQVISLESMEQYYAQMYQL